MGAHDPRALIEAAEQEAGAGNYSSAEHLLREAASPEETRLGPLHPDLANTLNNLAIVCEMANKLADAERCYRRAYSIAVTTLEPRPSVRGHESAEPRRLLARPRHARGELPKPEPTTTASDEHASMPAPLDEIDHGRLHRARLNPASGNPRAPSRSAPSPWVSSSSRCSSAFGRGSAHRNRPNPQQSIVSGRHRRARRLLPHPRPPSKPIPAPDDGTADSKNAGWHNRELGTNPPSDQMPAPAETPAQADTPVPAPALPATTADSTQAAASLPGAASAQLCTNLSTSTWSCDRAVSPLSPGSVVFYTRVTSENDTMVEHRWSVARTGAGGQSPHTRQFRAWLPHLQPADRRSWRLESRAQVQDGSLRTKAIRRGVAGPRPTSSRSSSRPSPRSASRP